jgi:dipeptidyl aminopeptidase/acylaminoacyl peptidase
MELIMKKILIIALAMVLALGSLAMAQDKRVLTAEDLFSLNRVGGYTMSPDGKYIAHTVSDIDLEANSSVTKIIQVPLDGGEPKFLANGGSPVWSPDGKYIAIGRSGQIWLLPTDGGEARQLTDLATGAWGAKWSADSKQILFVSLLKPKHECEGECADCKPDPLTAKVSAKTAEKLLYRHWNTWRTDGAFSHLFLVDVATGESKDLMPDATYDVPPFPFGGSESYDISADGKEVVFAAKVEAGAAWHTNIDIFIMDLESGKVTNITADNKAMDNGPVAYSPCGKYITYTAMRRPGFEADQINIILHDRASGEKKNLTKDFDRNVGEYMFSPTDGSIYLAADNHGRHPIFKLSMKDGKIEEVLGEGTYGSLGLTPDGKTLIYSFRSLDTPPVIRKANVDGSGEITLTHCNDKQLSEIQMGAVEGDHWFEGGNGDQVQVYVVKPPNFEEGKKYPLLHIIHGGPQQNYADLWTNGWNSQVFAAKGYVVALVCFHATPGYGQKFVDDVSKNWGGTPYEDIMKATDYLIGLGYIDEDRMAAGGGSYGGYMANWIATQTDRFDALVSHAGVYDLDSMWGSTEELWFPEWELGGTFWESRELYTKWSPHLQIHKATTPMLITHGQLDFRVPVTQGMEIFTALQRQGVPSKFIYYPDEDHWIQSYQNKYFWYKEFFAWLDKWVK